MLLLEWVIEFEQLCKKRKELCSCLSNVQKLEKTSTDPIWIVWDVLLYEATSRNNVLLSKVMNSLIDIFSIKYTGGVKKRRRFVLYYAISMLTEAVDFSVDIVQKPLIVKKVVEKVNNVYKDVKKMSYRQTDYLMNGIIPKKSNFKKIIERLEK